MLPKPKYQVGQVVARLNASGELDEYFNIVRIRASSSSSHWEYEDENEMINGLSGTSENNLRPLTRREIGPQRKPKGRPQQ